MTGSERNLTTLTWSENLGKRIRSGDWQDQTIPTVQKIDDLIAGKAWEPAAEMVDYFMEEAKICHKIYVGWSRGFQEWMRFQGVDDAEMEAELDRLKLLLNFRTAPRSSRNGGGMRSALAQGCSVTGYVRR